MNVTRDEAKTLLTNGGRRTSEDEVDRFVEEVKAGVPVMPITFFCEFLTKWADLSSVPVPKERQDRENRNRLEHGERARGVFLEIRKSNLLWRMIYAGEPARTTPCPVHKGRWSGCMLPEETGCKGACMHGNNVTGWLPDKENQS